MIKSVSVFILYENLLIYFVLFVMIAKDNFESGTYSVAKYSDCERYRYILSRTWDPSKQKILFIGLNPSTATELKNDPTVTRMMNFAKKWGFGSATVCNAFAFRATFPKELKKQINPVGEDNNTCLQQEIEKADKIVAAWGNHAKFLNRSQEILKFLNNFEHFGLTKQGEPRHVLYLRSDAKLEMFSLKS